jgi:hypothetical protein
LRDYLSYQEATALPLTMVTGELPTLPETRF